MARQGPVKSRYLPVRFSEFDGNYFIEMSELNDAEQAYVKGWMDRYASQLHATALKTFGLAALMRPDSGEVLRGS